MGSMFVAKVRPCVYPCNHLACGCLGGLNMSSSQGMRKVCALHEMVRILLFLPSLLLFQNANKLQTPRLRL